MDEMHATRAIVDLLSRMRADIASDLELCPAFKQPCLDPGTPNYGFKVHVRGADPDRVIAVIISPFDVDGSGHLAGGTEWLIREGLREFFLGRSTGRFTCSSAMRVVFCSKASESGSLSCVETLDQATAGTADRS